MHLFSWYVSNILVCCPPSLSLQRVSNFVTANGCAADLMPLPRRQKTRSITSPTCRVVSPPTVLTITIVAPFLLMIKPLSRRPVPPGVLQPVMVTVALKTRAVCSGPPRKRRGQRRRLQRRRRTRTRQRFCEPLTNSSRKERKRTLWCRHSCACVHASLLLLVLLLLLLLLPRRERERERERMTSAWATHHPRPRHSRTDPPSLPICILLFVVVVITRTLELTRVRPAHQYLHCHP